jgi:RNA polymerase sigma-70 factor (ECF subfamily)
MVHWDVLPRAALEPEATSDRSARAHRLDGVYREHADFAWRCLQRLGVPEADRPDALQEVFLVVHRKLDAFQARSQLSTWLYGICLRVASRQRRRSARRRERSIESLPNQTLERTPEHELEQRRLVERLDRLLERLPLEKRAVFVMFEIEEMSCEEIARSTGVAVGTVYSRLHHARKLFVQAVERDERRGGAR